MDVEQAYERGQDNAARRAFHELLRMGRSRGFPIVCTLGSHTEREQLRAAAILLLTIDGSASSEDLPRDLVLDPNRALYRDARLLLDVCKAQTEAAPEASPRPAMTFHEAWHRWFAWYPVPVDDGHAWLVMVERTLRPAIIGACETDSWIFRRVQPRPSPSGAPSKR